MHLRTALLFAFCWLAPPLSGQSVHESLFDRLLTRHLDSMFHDTLVQRLSQRPSGLSLAEVLREDAVFRLSDSNLVSLAAVMLESLQQVDSTTCAAFGPGGAGFESTFISLTEGVDSVTTDRWVYMMHQIMLTGLRDLPPGPQISRDSALQDIRTSLERLPPAEAALLRAAHGPRPSLTIRCQWAQRFFRDLVRMRAGQAGPLMRTLWDMSLH